MKVDASDALERLEKVERAFTRPGLTKLARQGERLLEASTRRAFQSRKDPDSGKGWAPRSRPAAWGLLSRTGNLEGAQDGIAKVWVGKFASRIYLKGAVRDAVYMTPSGAMSYHVIAGSLFYGRRTARSSRGTRLRGYSPRGGQMPGRGFSGMDAAARGRLANLAKRHAAEAVGG